VALSLGHQLIYDRRRGYDNDEDLEHSGEPRLWSKVSTATNKTVATVAIVIAHR
jgi:hypothetical protein